MLPKKKITKGLLIASFLLIPRLSGFAQTGHISGTVIDSETGETLIGVNVALAGTSLGTATDLEGKYRVSGLEAGSYNLIFSFIGYERKTVTGILVDGDGPPARVDVLLAPDAVGLGEVVVEARVIQDTDAVLLRMQSRAPAITDGLSAHQIRRSPDANSGEALRRVTGVSLLGGKFIFVRGIPERYNGTLLNGSTVASTEPDRRAFAYDLLPANLLQNVVVAKSATPDLPGDFSGGLLQLTTVDYPDEFTLSIGISGSYSSQTTFEPFLSSTGGARNHFGFDDGTRRLPDFFPERNLGHVSPDTLGMLVSTLPNNWGAMARSAPVNTSASLSVGNTIHLGGGHLGIVGALTYRNGYSTAGMIRRDFEARDQFRFDYGGTQHSFGVTWGGLFNASYRPSPRHSISLKNLYTRTADDQFTQLEGPHYEAQLYQRVTAMRFVARVMYSGQLIGEHNLQMLAPRGIQVRWEAARTSSLREEPDYRRLSYARPLDDPSQPMRAVVGFNVGLATGGRFFSNMTEDGWSGSLHLTMPLAGAKLQAGSTLETRDREFHSRLIGAVTPRRRFDYSLLLLPPELLFAPENFGDRGFILSESTSGANHYTAGQRVHASYGLVDAPLSFLTRRLRLVAGARVESSLQELSSTTLDGRPVDVNAPRTDVLPSANLTYRLSDVTNIRAAYSRNVNRPELRELAPFAYYDFEQQVTVYGNPELRQATIDNYDFRVETYPGIGELLSASVFYKRFSDAIERVVVPGISLSAERSFSNADFARNYGFEIESRVALARFAQYLERSSLQANYTLVRSTVDVSRSAMVIERKGRPLQGQSPYVINLGLNFVEPGLGTSISLLYNRLGSRVVEVATAFESDVIEEPRDMVDLVITQPVFQRYEIRLAARDLLGRPQRFTQNGELVRQNHSFGSYSVGISMRY